METSRARRGVPIHSPSHVVIYSLCVLSSLGGVESLNSARSAWICWISGCWISVTETSCWICLHRILFLPLLLHVDVDFGHEWVSQEKSHQRSSVSPPHPDAKGILIARSYASFEPCSLEVRLSSVPSHPMPNSLIPLSCPWPAAANHVDPSR